MNLFCEFTISQTNSLVKLLFIRRLLTCSFILYSLMVSNNSTSNIWIFNVPQCYVTSIKPLAIQISTYMMGNIFQGRNLCNNLRSLTNFFLRCPLIQANMVSTPYACLIQMNGVWYQAKLENVQLQIFLVFKKTMRECEPRNFKFKMTTVNSKYRAS